MNQTMNREIMEISVEDIIPNRFQPRLTFDMDALNELANSIREHGIIQPLVVRRLQDKFEIIAGERRYKAATLIGMKKVPCIIMDLNDNESAEVAVIENIQRKEMTPLEEAKSFKKILDKGYLTQEELAKRMGKSQSSVANKLRLLNLDEVVQDAILEGKISERHARSLLKIENKQDQRNILGEIINNRLTVRQTDELIKEKYDKGVDVINMNDNTYNNQFNNVNNMNNNTNNNQFNNANSMNNNVDNNQFNNVNVMPNMQSNIFNQPNNNAFVEEQPNSIFKSPIQEEPVNQQNTSNNPSQNPQSQYMSMPQVNIPVNNVTNDVNPQLNIMHNIGIIDEKKKEEEKPIINPLQPSSSLDIFKVNSNASIPESKDVDIQSVINPSVLSSTDSSNTPSQPQNTSFNPTYPQFNAFESANNGMNVDINQIKNNAQDIIQKEDNTKDISTLLSKDDKPENKFFIDLDMPKDFSSNPLESLPYKVKNTVTEITKKIDELKLQGVNIVKEETDLGNTYQIVIRIDK